MRKLILSVTLATLMMTPVQAADWQSPAVEVRPGAFVGAKVELSLGGKSAARPRAALALAPTINRISSGGVARTSIGEGLALNFGPKSRPTLTLAGVRADTALGLRPDGDVNADRELGISTGGWVAIGAGTLLTAVAAAYVVKSNECTECDQ